MGDDIGSGLLLDLSVVYCHLFWFSLDQGSAAQESEPVLLLVFKSSPIDISIHLLSLLDDKNNNFKTFNAYQISESLNLLDIPTHQNSLIRKVEIFLFFLRDQSGMYPHHHQGLQNRAKKLAYLEEELSHLNFRQ